MTEIEIMIETMTEIVIMIGNVADVTETGTETEIETGTVIASGMIRTMVVRGIAKGIENVIDVTVVDAGVILGAEVEAETVKIGRTIVVKGMLAEVLVLVGMNLRRRRRRKRKKKRKMMEQIILIQRLQKPTGLGHRWD